LANQPILAVSHRPSFGSTTAILKRNIFFKKNQNWLAGWFLWLIGRQNLGKSVQFIKKWPVQILKFGNLGN
jgi:hypothetical protein